MVSHVVCQSGELMPVDLVVMAAGISPEVRLAKKAGIDVNQAIVVDEKMKTSHPDVFALGECCEFEQQTFGWLHQFGRKIKVANNGIKW